jgi:hypothetical protein
MNMAHKQGVFEEKLREYLTASKERKGEILSSVCDVSGLTRKGAVKRFRRMQLRHPLDRDTRGRPRYYTPDVIAALHDVWTLGREACGENLHPMIGEHVAIQIREGRWIHGDEATAKLCAMSLGSVKGYVNGFTRTQYCFGGRGTTKSSAIATMVPVRMDGWDTAETGVMQIDTVAHCGDSVAGDFVYTVNAVDVSTLWGVRRAQWQKGQVATRESIVWMRARTPFPWTELHPDSGSEFLNYHLLAYANDTPFLRLTRSRPYHKNDNHLVEERNGHIVRTYLGWMRFDVPEVVDALNTLYDVLDQYENHFRASIRIVTKERVGARWKVTREKRAQTPYTRVLLRDDVSPDVKDCLRKEHALLDPHVLLREIDRRRSIVFAIQKRHGIPPLPAI